MGREQSAPVAEAASRSAKARRLPPRQRTVTSGLAGALFSQVQQRVLGLLFSHPDRSFHASEIIRLVHSGSGAVQRELEKLSKAGIITVTISANRKLYQANPQSPIFDELYGLVVKTMGLVEPLRRALAPLRAHIAFAFVYGSIAKGTDTAKSDVDLMIVGDRLAYEKVYRALAQVEAELHRAVNPNIMTKAVWQQTLAAKNPFLTKVLAQPKLFVVGGEKDAQGAR